VTFTVPTEEPDVLRAGETWHWTRVFDQFPTGDGWTLSYNFAGVGKLKITATVINNQFDILANPQDTASLPPGRYVWDALVTIGSETHVADSGVLTVLPNLDTAATGSQQTHNERMLGYIEAELERRLLGVAAGGAGAIEAYVIHGRSVTKIPTEKLAILRGQYRAAVNRERNPGRIGTPIGVTFGPTQ